MKTVIKHRNRKMKFAMIATYPELSKMLAEFCGRENIEFQNIYAYFNEAADVAKALGKSVDVIFTRGSTGKYVEQAACVPVIEIPISPFDLTSTVAKLPDETKEFAFFNYEKIVYGISDIEEIFSKKIYEYTFSNRSDIISGVKDMQKKGIKTLIGGNVAAEIAEAMNLTGIEVINGKENVYRAFREAIKLVKAQRIEAEKAFTLETAFNAIKEGLIVTDAEGKVSMCNTTAGSLLHVNSGDVVGSNIQNVLDFGEKRPQEIMGGSYLKKIENVTINVQHLPIKFEKEKIGYVSTFEDITKIQKLEERIRKKLNEKGFKAKWTFEDIVTESKSMMDLKNDAALYAQMNSTILIEGESGTGKEMFAQSIHNASSCADGPFVAVNCAAIPENLLESELFGYDAGAFTGAQKDGKRGLFEIAHNGTMFLDEIGEIPQSLQARLLRVLQEREIMHVGGDKIIPVDVRIICATNKPLEKKIETGEFREDLYYRINVFNVKIPPLRHRKEDLQDLSYNLLNRMNFSPKEADKKLLKEKVFPAFEKYNWPGNIRELQNMLERIALFMKNGNEDRLEQMLEKLRLTSQMKSKNVLSLSYKNGESLNNIVSDVEREIIGRVLKECGGNQHEAAKQLAISRTTLWRKYSKN